MTESPEKEKYIKSRDNFHTKKDNKLKQIEKYKSKIKLKKQKISKLEGQIEKLRPILDDCVDYLTCTTCDIYSMALRGRINLKGIRPAWRYRYVCQICDDEKMI